MGQKTPHDCSQSVNSHGAKETHSYLFIIISYLSPRSGRFRVIVCRHSRLFLYRFLGCIVTGRVRELTYWYRVGSVSVCGTALFSPVSFTPVGAARSRPGRQVGDPYQAQKLLACSSQQDTTYSLFTITYYLRPRRWAMPGGLGHQRIGTGSAASLSAAQLSPPLVSTMYQVGRVRAVMYPYKPRSVTVRRHSRQKKPRRLARLFCLCWHYLSSRQVTLQVLSAQMSLTSVFGMGTGGPSSQSIPTRVDGVEPSFMSKPSLGSNCFAFL